MNVSYWFHFPKNVLPLKVLLLQHFIILVTEVTQIFKSHLNFQILDIQKMCYFCYLCYRPGAKVWGSLSYPHLFLDCAYNRHPFVSEFQEQTRSPKRGLYSAPTGTQSSGTNLLMNRSVLIEPSYIGHLRNSSMRAAEISVSACLSNFLS